MCIISNKQPCLNPTECNNCMYQSEMVHYLVEHEGYTASAARKIVEAAQYDESQID